MAIQDTQVPIYTKHTLFFYFFFKFFLFYFYESKIKIKNWKIRKIQKQCVFMYIGTCVP